MYTSIIFSQTQEVTYSISFNTDVDMIEDYLGKNAQDKVKLYTTTLLFNDTFMKYFQNPSKLSRDDYSILEAATYTEGNYYKQNNSNVVFLEEKEPLHKDTLLSYRYITHWEYATDVKEILGYTCKKASCVLKIDYGNGKLDTLYPITAWYTEKLAFGCGPKGISVPEGFILELEDKIVTYTAQTILKSTENNIFFDTHKKVITMEDLFRKVYKLKE
ncbi:GLPGLI family protein [Flavobacterium croceum DSM 17960]|uniref:GLPGLI family protein n=2 Tax=Flavobacterium TaxID=237 RepID=A0A2S4N6U0_9FLAO|nr:GLPGLI family protein [Flavobacterium croceum DSM 17960]